MLRKIFLVLVLCGISIAAVILVGIYYFLKSYRNSLASFPFLELLIFLAALTAIYTLFLTVLVAFLDRQNKALTREIITLQNINQELRRNIRDLQNKLELLSAMREVSLILNEDVDFQTILKKVLMITAQLAGPQKEAHQVTIYLKEDSSRSLIPKALYCDGKVYFEDELKKKFAVDNKNVPEAFEHQRVFLSTDGEEFVFTLPLVADRDTLGVIKIKTSLDCTPEEKSEYINNLQNILQEFTKIIALAIKTPNLYTRTITDALTGLFTKRHFFTQLRTYWELARRYHEPLSLIMIDIDHFKKINDTYGHPIGDQILKNVSEIICRNIRASTTAYRYGGEEIVLILPNTTQDGAYALAERLRKKVEAHHFNIPGIKRLKVTISLGISQYQAEMKSPEELINRADYALYQAKQKGRNKTWTWGTD